MTLKFKKIHPQAKLPERSTEGSSGYDLRAVNVSMATDGSRVVRVNTGLVIEIPKGWRGHIYDRSSMAAKGWSVLAGEIDSDYRGPLDVLLRLPDNLVRPNIELGDKVAQIVFTPYGDWPSVWVDEVSDTARGDGGFGSTGR